MKDILLTILCFLSAALAIWAMILDEKLHQLRSYVDRLEKER